MKGELIPLGVVVKPYGKVGAVMVISGERYYFLVDRRGGVAMMPADVIESRRRSSMVESDSYKAGTLVRFQTPPPAEKTSFTSK